MIKIIGAGPAGTYLGALLAKSQDVELFDQKSVIGKPVQCTGIFSNEIKKFVYDDSFVINKTKKIRVNNIEFNSQNIIVDRTLFDQFLANKAQDAGAKINLNHKYISNDRNKVTLQNKNKLVTKEFTHLIGADGPFSNVDKNNFQNQNQFVIGHQVRAKTESDPDIVDIYFNHGYFAWKVPESDKIARIALITHDKSKEQFDSFIKNFKHKVIEHQSGFIPVYQEKQIQNNNVYLIGDAASQVKASTFGGIIPAFKSAHKIQESIIKNKAYTSKDFELKLHKKIYEKINKMDLEKRNKLIKDLEKSKSILENTNRDNVTKLSLKLLLNQPSLIKYLF